MFKAIKETDSFNCQHTHYYLTQGDSCTITSTPFKADEIVPKANISKCVFKLANTSYKLVQEIELVPPSEDRGAYILNIPSIISSALIPGSYVYEIEYTMTDGSVQTPHSWKFDILKQISN